MHHRIPLRGLLHHSETPWANQVQKPGQIPREAYGTQMNNFRARFALDCFRQTGIVIK
jgi:hypothetical protein